MKSKQPYWQIKGAILLKNQRINLKYINQEILMKNQIVIQKHLNLIRINQVQIIILVSHYFNNQESEIIYSLQRYQESLIYFDVALNLEPNSPDSFNQKGMSLKIINKYYDVTSIKQTFIGHSLF